jgi:hypothetical protein
MLIPAQWRPHPFVHCATLTEQVQMPSESWRGQIATIGRSEIPIVVGEERECSVPGKVRLR